MSTYFSYDPDDGIRFHETAEEAKARVSDSLERAEFNAADSDWHWQDNEHEICWGIVCGRVSVTDRDLTPEEKEENPDWSFIRKVELEDLPAAPQTDGEERG